MMELAKIATADGQEITVTRDDVRRVICENATDSEISMFLSLCQSQGLNPFVKDAYLVKYRDNPASIITSKDVFTRRAAANPSYQGFEAGVTVLTQAGQITRRQGSAIFAAAHETLLGGWARVFVEGKQPFFDEVSLAEYSTGRANWARMPGTMIRKVALVHCLREAFPDSFQGLYSAEEMDRATQQQPQQAYEVPTEPQPKAVPDTSQEECSDERTAAIMADVERFAKLRGKTTAEAMSALFSSRAALAVGCEAGRAFTNQQADTLEELLAAWIEKAEARAAAEVAEANTAAAQPAPVDGLEGVQFEEVADDGDYGEPPAEQPALYPEDVKF